MDDGSGQNRAKPEIETYRSVLDKAIREGEGKITSTKAQILMKVRKTLGIPEYEHNKILSELLKKYEERHLAVYRSAVEQALTDDRFTSDEEAILKSLRDTMNISIKDHNIIVNEVRAMIESKKSKQARDDETAGVEQPAMDESDSYYWVQKGEMIWASSEGMVNKALKALTYFDKALELDEMNYLAWANKGLVLKSLNRVEDALLCYNRALKINPEFTTVWYNKGVLLGSIGNFTEAIKAFDRVLELNPEHEFAIRDRRILLSIISENSAST